MNARLAAVLAICVWCSGTVQGNEPQPEGGSEGGSSTRSEQGPGFARPRQPGFGAQPFQPPGLTRAGAGQPFGAPTFRQQPGLGPQPVPGGQQLPGFQTGPFSNTIPQTPDLPINAYDYGMCTLDPKGTRFNVRGLVQLRQARVPNAPLEMVINITGVNPNQNHGFQARTWGDLSNGCTSTADVFNPIGVQHGGPNDVPFPSPGMKTRMIGSFGNLLSDQFGQVNTRTADRYASLSRDEVTSILGRSFVVFERQDDLGTTFSTASLINGNVGDAMACCVIGRADATSWPGNRDLLNQLQGVQGTNIFRGQQGFLPGQPLGVPGQPFLNPNPQNPQQPTQPNQRAQPNTQPNTQPNRFNPFNPTAPFNPLPGQFANSQFSNPSGFNFAGASNPLARRAFSPASRNPGNPYRQNPNPIGANPFRSNSNQPGAAQFRPNSNQPGANLFRPNPVGANPRRSNPVGANPLRPNQAGPNPFRPNPNPRRANPPGPNANPMGANPSRPNPFGLNPVRPMRPNPNPNRAPQAGRQTDETNAKSE